MKIQIYTPDSAEKQREINRRAAKIRIMCMENYLKGLSCTSETKIRLLKEAADFMRQK